MKLSIIIVNYNTRDILKDCIDSIARYHPCFEYEIIVVDNASTDGTAEMLRASYGYVKLISNSSNLGFATANNIGIKASSGDFVLLLNSDTEVVDGSLEGMITYMASHPRVGVLGPRLLDKNFRIIQISWAWHPTIIKETFQKMLSPQNITNIKLINILVRFLNRKARHVDLVPGACMLIRREVLDAVGGLDENLFLYFEESDLCKRSSAAGWETMYIPTVNVIHKLGQTMKKNGKMTLLHYRRSQLYYYRKHNSKLQLALLKKYLYLKFIILKTMKSKESEFANQVLQMSKEY